MADSRSLATLRGPVVIDASVVVEYLIVSPLTLQAQALLRTRVEREVEFWAPDLVYAESVSALRKLESAPRHHARRGEQAVEDLLRLPIHDYEGLAT